MSLTYGLDEHIEKAKGKQRLWQFTEKQLQRTSDDMNVLPLAVTQIQLLLWGGKQKEEAGNNYNISLLMSKLENANHDVSVLLFLQ